jgi:hypothetical protein
VFVVGTIVLVWVVVLSFLRSTQIRWSVPIGMLWGALYGVCVIGPRYLNVHNLPGLDAAQWMFVIVLLLVGVWQHRCGDRFPDRVDPGGRLCDPSQTSGVHSETKARYAGRDMHAPGVCGDVVSD